jgi:DNA-binding NarL/FixJ family response regulator
MNLAESGNNSIKVFLVEDSEIMADLISDKVEKLSELQIIGKSATVSGTFEQLVLKKPDVVILDLKLKDGNGIDILTRIKQSKLPAKVIVFTMNNSFEKECRKAGCDFFFDKSGDFDELMNALTYMSYMQKRTHETTI